MKYLRMKLVYVLCSLITPKSHFPPYSYAVHIIPLPPSSPLWLILSYSKRNQQFSLIPFFTTRCTVNEVIATLTRARDALHKYKYNYKCTLTMRSVASFYHSLYLPIHLHGIIQFGRFSVIYVYCQSQSIPAAPAIATILNLQNIQSHK